MKSDCSLRLRQLYVLEGVGWGERNMFESRKHLFWESHSSTVFSKVDPTGTQDTAHTCLPNQFHHLGKEHYFPHRFKPEVTPLSVLRQPGQPPHTIHVSGPWSALILVPSILQCPQASAAPLGPASLHSAHPKASPLCLEPFLCSHCSQVKLLRGLQVPLQS